MSGNVCNEACDAELSRLLLRPSSIALVGASDDPTKTTGRPLRFLRAAKASPRIYPVNPHREHVQGESAWPSLSALPEIPDHVFVLSGTDSVLTVVQEAARLGVRLITVLASGYSESGEEGVRREAELSRLCRDVGMRLLGPNSLGLVHPASGLYLTANAAFAEPGLPSGRVFVASQSGSLLGALVSRGKSRGVGFAGLISVGSESDLSVGEICEAVLDEPDIDVFLLFLENLRHAGALQRFARAAANRGKTVMAYKLGRSEAAAELAASHTGALSGEDAVADAFFRGLGIARLSTMESMLEAPTLARAWPLRQRLVQSSRFPAPRIGVVTTTGGGAAMAVDQLSLRGVDVCSPAPQTLQRLREAGLNASGARVLDLTLAGTRYEVMKAALDILTAAPEFDLVLAVIGSSARFQPELAVKPAIDVWSQGGRLAVMVVPDAPQALLALTQAGIPNFRTPESCADSISATLGRHFPGTPAVVPESGWERRALNEFQAYKLLEKLDVPHAACVLAALHEPIKTLPFAGPYVVKACAPELLHKTEAGGVVVGVQQVVDLPATVLQITGNVEARAPQVCLEQVLVQQMVAGPVCEALLGYRVDAQVGPMVMLAAGGIWAETLQDRSLRMAPVDLQTALDMIDEVRMLRVLDGLRGHVAGDRLALAHALVNMSQCALRPELGVLEAEINPLFVMPVGQGVVAVDALVICSDSSVLTEI